MSSPRALLVHSGNLFGGIETALVSLAHVCHQQTPPLRPTFALCFDGRLGHELVRHGMAVHSLGAVRVSRPWLIQRARTRLRRLLQSGDFDLCVLLSTWSSTIFSPTIRQQQLPVVLWAHDRLDSHRWLDRLALRHRPDLIIANSRYTADGVTTVLPDTPIRVVYCPLAPPPPVQRTRAEIRAEFETPADAVVVVQVGRLEGGKGHRLLIDALARLPAALPWRCWIVGGADTSQQHRYLAELKTATLAAGLADRVRFTGARQDVDAILSAADIFCHPNVASESFGLVFVEALRAGLPVIGTVVGGVSEIVTESCGRLVEPGTVSPLVHALTEMIESPELRLALGSRGAERAATLCDASDRVAELATAFSSVVRSTSALDRTAVRKTFTPRAL